MHYVLTHQRRAPGSAHVKTSTERILTTHTGSLPRPKPLVDLILGRERGEPIDEAAFEAATRGWSRNASAATPTSSVANA
jgi:hypothetical protein